MPSFAYSIARCWVIVSRPPLVIIGTAAVTPRIGLRAKAAVIVTMLPPVFCANICLIVSWVTYRKPSRLVDTSDLKSSGVYSVSGLVKKVGELAEERRREAVVRAGGEPVLWSATNPLPNANAAVEPAPGTRPELTPIERHYRIDINTIPPKVDEQQWRLQIAGLVENPVAFTLQDLQRYEPMHQFVTLSCISNPVGGDLIDTTRWTGVSLQRLF